MRTREGALVYTWVRDGGEAQVGLSQGCLLVWVTPEWDQARTSGPFGHVLVLWEEGPATGSLHLVCSLCAQRTPWLGLWIGVMLLLHARGQAPSTVAVTQQGFGEGLLNERTVM